MSTWPEAPVTVVVSDLHANARALSRALELARRGPMDRLVILGDLLTYGVDVVETLDLVEAEVARGAILISGNHDQLYLDLAAGDRTYYAKLPGWLRETADWTADRVSLPRFSKLPWLRDHVADGVLFAHANPFEYGNWRYLDSPKDFADAIAVLESQGRIAGVFGHNHRAVCFSATSNGDAVEGETGPVLLNPGSAGQPRIQPPRSTMLRLAVSERRVWGRVEAIDYNVAAHVEAVRAAGFSEATTTKLCGFFAAQ